MGNYFCGWYFRCQSGQQTFAVIPSIHRANGEAYASIQLITDTHSFCARFPDSDFQKGDRQVRIAGSRFSEEGILLDIRQPGLHASGSLGFGPLAPIGYDIMGPFRCVPFMQCRHTVYSMRHQVDGELTVNGTPFSLRNALGYIEGDRGRSFPSKYLWTQTFFPGGSLMLSIGDIPMGIFHFTGIIGIVLLEGKEYRLATYLGAKAVKITPEAILVRQGRFTLAVQPKSLSGHALQAPVGGAMERTIHEHPACPVSFRFTENGVTLAEFDAPNAALEYEF